MFIIDQPYASDVLIESINKLKLPVLENALCVKQKNIDKNLIMNDEEAKNYLQKESANKIYTNSENSLSWILSNLENSPLKKQINLFKNKVAFRELLKPFFPNFFFEKVLLEDLDKIDYKSLPYPLIIKPSVGFFSLAVFRVDNFKQYPKTVENIKNEIQKFKDLYPENVMDSSSFILEQVIEGEEFAIDAYYDEKGDPVILNILAHLFASDYDMSDRVYYSSAKLVKKYSEKFMPLLKEISKLSGVKSFPFHLELRITKENEIIPIELNPLRFAGWCTTDLAYYAYKISNYEMFFNNQKPNWDQIEEETKEQIFSINIADLPKNIDATAIKSIDYKRLKSYFSNILEFREVDYKKYYVMAFIFSKTHEKNKKELLNFLNADLSTCINLI